MALTALICLVLADDSKIVLPALFAFAFALVVWSLRNAKGKADKDYVDKNIEDVKNYVKSEIQTHEKNDDRIREQLNCTMASMDKKIDMILEALMPNQTKSKTK